MNPSHTRTYAGDCYMDHSILQSYYGMGLTFKLKPELQSHGRISGVSLPLQYLIQLETPWGSL